MHARGQQYYQKTLNTASGGRDICTKKKTAQRAVVCVTRLLDAEGKGRGEGGGMEGSGSGKGDIFWGSHDVDEGQS